MSKFRLSPYFHPTTVCFVDDNEAFLDSLALELAGDWSARYFTDPERALAFLNAPDPLPPLADRCFSVANAEAEDPLIQLDLTLIGQEINHRERFQRRSVVVVDYAMPEMNGLEFCERLEDPYIRKALLTGVADEVLAVQAFNDGLIDRYVPKQSLSSIRAVQAFVSDLQQSFFLQYTQRLSTMLALRPPGFLKDPSVSAFIEKLMAERDLVEYYLVGDPPGFLFLNSAGALLRLVILNPAEVEQQIQFARTHGAPEYVSRALRRGDVVGHFSDFPGDFFDGEPYPWEENLLAAVHLTGSAGHGLPASGSWVLGIDDDPPSDIDFDSRYSAYDAFLGYSRVA